MSVDLPRACVIGHPIAHSLSPILHGEWLKDLGLSGRYEAWDVAPGDLEAAIGRLRREGYRGANITIPYKEAVRAFLDIEAEGARAIGAVNTLVIEGGRIRGSNTDAFGYVAHLQAELPAWREALRGRPVLVLGAGGAARGVVYGLAEAGVGQFLIANRGASRAERLASDFAALAHVTVIDWGDREWAVREAGLIINATPLGMKEHEALDLDLSHAKGAIVADLVYNPIETSLLRAARVQGLPRLDGLGMLIHQGRPGFKAWFGADPPIGPTLRARLLAALSGR